MNHLIIGSGVVGSATGKWLKANNENVFYYDNDEEVLNVLKKGGYATIKAILPAADIYWICTAEWNVDEVMQKLSQIAIDGRIIVIRSTTSPGTMEKINNQYGQYKIVHNPEFLKASTAIDDMFNPDRVVIGTHSEVAGEILTWLYSSGNAPIVITTPTTSEIIKLVSNCWLASQISFWNEIKDICDKHNVNSHEVAKVSSLDVRISEYGTIMLGTPFSGFCLPKDLDALIQNFEDNNLDPVLLKAVKKVNEK